MASGSTALREREDDVVPTDYTLQPGTTPVLISIPHGGTDLPPDLARRLSPAGSTLADTDWHLDRLYDFAPAMGVGVLAARLSRTAIDLNRDPAGVPLYPGADNTELCPTSSFDREPLYLPGQEPDAAEVARRRDAWWQPYHDGIAAELARLHARHGIAVLFDAHSIRSRVPRFFDGRLPDFNLGTADDASADPALAQRLMAVLDRADGFTAVCNGRFKGGYITRHYGRPGAGIHAAQLELAQITYMDESPPFAWRDEAAVTVQPVLRRLIAAVLGWAAERVASIG